jgi:cytolysin (calcineurin-like family phosphatase)
VGEGESERYLLTRERERMNGYDYRVIFITDYLTIITQVNLMPDDDNFNNLSSQAYEQAVMNGMNNIVDELGKFDETLINDITVSLLLDDEEIEVGK